MAKNSFSKKEALVYAWETFKKNWQFLLVVIIVVAAVNFIPSIFQNQLKNNFPAFSFVLGLAAKILQIVVSIGLIAISLKFIDGKKPIIEDLFKHYNLAWNYFLSSLLYGLIVFAGVLLLVVPGIIWAVKFQFYSYFVVDKKMGPLEAISASGKLTQGHKWNLFLLGLIFAGLCLLGIIAFGIGIFIVWPVIMIATAYVYRKLS